MQRLISAGLLPLVYAHLGTYDAIKLSRTSQQSRAEWIRLFVISARRALGRFVNDVSAFMKWLHVHGCVISGSFVVSLLAGVNYGKGSDLDVYCKIGAGSCLASYLVDCEKYKISDRPSVSRHAYGERPSVKEDIDADDYLLFGQANLNQIIKLTSPEGLGIDVIESVHSDPKELLFSFHSTVVVNALTSTELICFYPKLTFAGKNQSLNHKLIDRTRDLIYNKWSKRGFEPLPGVATRQLTRRGREEDYGFSKNRCPLPARIPCPILSSADRKLPVYAASDKKANRSTDGNCCAVTDALVRKSATVWKPINLNHVQVNARKAESQRLRQNLMGKGEKQRKEIAQKKQKDAEVLAGMMAATRLNNEDE